MAYQVPTALPSSLAAGDTWTWTRELSDYPVSEGWSLVAHVVGATQRIDVTAAGSASVWTFTATATQTAALSPGAYRVTLRATNGTEVRTVEIATLTVTSAANTVAPGEDLTEAEKMVKALRAELLRRANGQMVASYSIAGRSLTYESISTLNRMLASYLVAVERERGGSGQAFAASFGGVR